MKQCNAGRQRDKLEEYRLQHGGFRVSSAPLSLEIHISCPGQQCSTHAKTDDSVFQPAAFTNNAAFNRHSRIPAAYGSSCSAPVHAAVRDGCRTSSPRQEAGLHHNGPPVALSSQPDPSQHDRLQDPEQCGGGGELGGTSLTLSDCHLLCQASALVYEKPSTIAAVLNRCQNFNYIIIDQAAKFSLMHRPMMLGGAPVCQQAPYPEEVTDVVSACISHSAPFVSKRVDDAVGE